MHTSSNRTLCPATFCDALHRAATSCGHRHHGGRGGAQRAAGRGRRGGVHGDQRAAMPTPQGPLQARAASLDTPPGRSPGVTRRLEGWCSVPPQVSKSVSAGVVPFGGLSGPHPGALSRVSRLIPPFPARRARGGGGRDCGGPMAVHPGRVEAHRLPRRAGVPSRSLLKRGPASWQRHSATAQNPSTPRRARPTPTDQATD